MKPECFDLAFAARVSGTQKALLLTLAYRTNKKSGEAWPSLEKLAWDLGITKRNVQAALRQLVDAGLIVAENRKGGRGNRTVYRFPMDDDGDTLSREKDDDSDTERMSISTQKGDDFDIPLHIEKKEKIKKSNSSGGERVALRAEQEKASPVQLDAFEKFWLAYPVKGGRKSRRAAGGRKVRHPK